MKKHRTYFSRVASLTKATKFKKWYKKYIHRINRRKAKQNPEAIDKRLDGWEFD